eukprot:3357653-Amphidinium_carterae.1
MHKSAKFPRVSELCCVQRARPGSRLTILKGHDATGASAVLGVRGGSVTMDFLGHMDPGVPSLPQTFGTKNYTTAQKVPRTKR